MGIMRLMKGSDSPTQSLEFENKPGALKIAYLSFYAILVGMIMGRVGCGFVNTTLKSIEKSNYQISIIGTTVFFFFQKPIQMALVSNVFFMGS